MEQKGATTPQTKRKMTIRGGDGIAVTRKTLGISGDLKVEKPTPQPGYTGLSEEAIKIGYLCKRGGGKPSRAWRQRLFVLTTKKMLYYFRGDEEKPRGFIDLSIDYTIEEYQAARRMFCFKLIPPNPNDRVWHISGLSKEEVEAWIRAITDNMKSGQEGQQKVIFNIEEKLRMCSFCLPPEELEFSDQLLGKGSSGVVKKGNWLKTTDVAIKILNGLPEFISPEELQEFYKEMETLSQLRHPYIVSMYGYCKKDDYICLITEFVKGGNLSDAIYSNRPLDLKLQIQIALSIARGIVYLHTKNIVHRDLKPGNILVENLEEAKLKVCDFGLSGFAKGNRDATAVTAPSRHSQYFGTPAYAAPELPTPSHTNKVDVYSFAVVLHEMFTRTRPWSHLDYPWQISEAVNRGERPPIPENCSFRLLISNCWAQEPRSRPSFQQIYEYLTIMQEKYEEGILTEGLMELVKQTTLDSSSLQDNSETRILRTFKGQPTMSWDNFAKVVSIVLETRTERVEKLRYLLETDGYVERAKWENLMKWFSPLAEPNNYKQSSFIQQSNGYSFEEIAEIVASTWFFGFLTQSQTIQILNQKPPGSFLFRFSTTSVGSYTLSVATQIGIAHWRITCEKITGIPVILKINSRQYSSFEEIITVHSSVPIDASNVLLTSPCDRDLDAIPK